MTLTVRQNTNNRIWVVLQADVPVAAFLTEKEADAFVLGAEEAHGDFGMTYDESPRSRAYDLGRSHGQKVPLA